MVNRGIAKRPLFERRADMRFFLARLARQVRLGRIEVHAYCLMTTHFHLLLRSPIGELSEAMRRVQNEHSRHFNRGHRRDGPLIRGRYFSRRVDSVRYRRVVVSYIDANPVRAGMAPGVGDYEFCSARAYMHREKARWLSREWVTSVVESVSGEPLSPRTYRAVFAARGATATECLEDLVEARMSSSARTDALEDLIGTAPPNVRAWMEAKARLADGLEPGLPIVGPATLRAVLEADLAARGGWQVEDGRTVLRGQELARIGLLRLLCGMTWQSIGDQVGSPPSSAARLAGVHARLQLSDTNHAERTEELARKALDLVYGS